MDGDAIRRAREDRGWTKVGLAQRLGVSDMAVHYWETGRNEPRLEHEMELRRLLGLLTDEEAVDKAAQAILQCHRTRGRYDGITADDVISGHVGFATSFKRWGKLMRCALERAREVEPEVGRTTNYRGG